MLRECGGASHLVDVGYFRAESLQLPAGEVQVVKIIHGPHDVPAARLYCVTAEYSFMYPFCTAS